LDCEST